MNFENNELKTKVKWYAALVGALMQFGQRDQTQSLSIWLEVLEYFWEGYPALIFKNIKWQRTAIINNFHSQLQAVIRSALNFLLEKFSF